MIYMFHLFCKEKRNDFLKYKLQQTRVIVLDYRKIMVEEKGITMNTERTQISNILPT